MKNKYHLHASVDVICLCIFILHKPESSKSETIRVYFTLSTVLIYKKKS